MFAIVLVQKEYIRNMEVFCGEDTEFFGSDNERYWKEREMSGFVGIVEGSNDDEIEESIQALIREKDIPENVIEVLKTE